jgi:hypothetical protein
MLLNLNISDSDLLSDAEQFDIDPSILNTVTYGT